jgi:2,5-dihydroxypyridine 5,6-dioxygenase
VITRSAEILALGAEILRLCRVKPEEKLAIYIDTGRESDLGQLIFGAAVAHGCDPYLVLAPLRTKFAPLPPGAVAALKAADVVFDLAKSAWLYTPATNEILAAGTRMLQFRASDSRFFDVSPREKIMPKAKAAVRFFKEATQLRITSALGTDLTVDYSGRPPHGQDGVVEEPGEWDSLGTAFANVCPNETSGEGVVVLNGPNYLAGGPSFITQEPITLTIRAGRITKVDGGAEARLFADYLSGQGNAASHVIAHMGFGFDPRCGPPPKPIGEFADAGSWEPINGGVIVAFGANKGPRPWGGANAAPTHIDCVLLGANLFLGNTQIIREGTFVVPGFDA